MSGIERDSSRVKATAEVFTPTELVQESLNLLPQNLFIDPTENFLDYSCGDGQFLSEVLIRKMENGIDFTTALESLFGVDLMEDNCKLCRERLLCGSTDPEHIQILETNIVNADALRYHYRFDNTHPYDDEAKEKQKEEHWNELFEET